MVIWIDMVCLALALAPSCAALHFWCLYIMLSKSYLPRRCDWKDGAFYKSPTPIMQIFPMPTPHVASLLASSSVSAQLPTGEIGLHQLHWACCVTEPIPLHTQLSSSFLFTCNWTSPKSDWAALVTLTKKGRKVSKTWWGEWIIGWRKLEHFSALMRRSLTDKRHTASYLGSPSMSHQVPNGNRLSPRQLDPISHSPRQYLYIVVLSSSFIW